MTEDILRKLWILKFCVKVVYPKYNYYSFLVYLAIKYRIRCQKRQFNLPDMESYEVKTVPLNIAKLLIQEKVKDNVPVLVHKCVIISRKQFLQLASENFFYIDNGVLWIALKLSEDMKRNHRQNLSSNKETSSNLHSLMSKFHKELWPDKEKNNIDNIRIVPIVGSKLVKDNTALTNEDEYFNMTSCFGLSAGQDMCVTFHPVPNINNAPKIAAAAEVSVIDSVYDIENDFLKEVLNNHFDAPKLMSINDTFSIELSPEITAKFHYKYLDVVDSSGRLYFQVTKASSDANKDNESKENSVKAFYIVKGVTQLSLGVNIHSLSPRNEYFKLKEGRQIYIAHLCPTGLKQKFNQIQEAIQPFLTGEMNQLSSSLTSPILPMLLLTGSTGSGRHLLAKILAKHNGLNYLAINCNTLQSSTAKQTESKISVAVNTAKEGAPSILLLDNFEVFAVDPENNEDSRILEYFMCMITDLHRNYTKHPIIFIAVTERQDLKPNVLRIFLEKFHIPRLTVQQRYEMLEWFATVMQLNIDGEQLAPSELTDTESVCLSQTVRDVLHRVAAKTETFLYGDLDTLLHFAIRDSYLKQHKSQIPADPDLHVLQEDNFNLALESIRSLRSQHLDAPKIPKVYWQDIGGLEKLKKELLKTIEFPIKYPHLFKNSTLKRSGILLYGPPGCGKTLVAKAVSTELNVSFMSVKGPELLNMYIGQSEENVRKVFESARASSPCIVFLDELDALAPRRGAAGDSGGASDRVVSQLLAEVDGVSSGEDADTSSFVFIMGATNRPDLLEQSLLRPGRLDKLIYVGPYNGLHEKTCVLKALCRNYRLREEVDLETVAAALPDSCTGADLLQVVSAARSAAVRAIVAKLNAGTVKESELSPDSVILGNSEMWEGVESFHPSVTSEELAYYESLQSQV